MPVAALSARLPSRPEGVRFRNSKGTVPGSEMAGAVAGMHERRDLPTTAPTPMASTTPVSATTEGKVDRRTETIPIIWIGAAVVCAVSRIIVLVVGIVPVSRAVPMPVVPPASAAAI